MQEFTTPLNSIYSQNTTKDNQESEEKKFELFLTSIISILTAVISAIIAIISIFLANRNSKELQKSDFNYQNKIKELELKHSERLKKLE